jgi:hypothetical protein
MRATHQQKGSVTARQKVEGHGPQSLDRPGLPGQEGAEKYVPDMTPELDGIDGKTASQRCCADLHIHAVSYVMRLLKTKWAQEHSARKRGIG